jgi:hypothetical protein
LTYVIAIGLFALSGLVLEQIGGNTTVLIDGQEVQSVTAKWLRYAWYQSAFVQLVVLAHAAFCSLMVLRFRRKTKRAWFTFIAIALASIYVAYALYSAYWFFNPDPNIRPITDHF